MAKDFPTYESKGSIQIPSVEGGFAEAAMSMSGNATLIGSIGAEMAQNASIAMGTELGYRGGLKPHGDLMPAITNFDKAMQGAYEAQSNATLSLQAQELYNKSELELARLPKLNQGAIDNFQQSMSQGLADIASVAPSNVKRDLENTFAAKMIQSTGNLNKKMVAQQMADSAEEYTLYQNKTLQSIYNMGFQGGGDQARKLYEKLLKDNAGKKDGGYLSASQVETSNTAAKLALHAGQLSSQGIAAQDEKKEGEFLDNLFKHRHDDLSPIEFEQVGKQVISAMASHSAYKKNLQSLMLTQGDYDIATGQMTQAKMSELESYVDPVSFLKAKVKWLAKQGKAGQMLERISKIYAGLQNPAVVANAAPKDLDATFNFAVALTKQKAFEKNGQEISDMEAKTQIASNSVAVFPVLKKEMEVGLNSPNESVMENYAEFYQGLLKGNSPTALAISPQAQAFYYKYASLKSKGINNPAQTAFNEMKTSKDTIANTELALQVERSKHFKTPAKKIKFATDNLVDLPSSVSYGNKLSIASQAIRAYEDNFKLNHSDRDAAIAQTKANMSLSYGTSLVNGKPSYTQFPIDKLIGQSTGLGEKVLPFIHQDIALQMQRQFAANNEGFDKGLPSYNYKYEIAPRINYDEAIAAKTELANMKGQGVWWGKTGLSGQEVVQRVIDLRRIISKYEQNNPIEIIETPKDPKQKPRRLKANVESNYLMVASSNPNNPVIGDYDLRFTDGKGGFSSPVLVSNSMQTWLHYRPNLGAITESATALLGIPVETKTLAEMVQEFRTQQEQGARPTMSEAYARATNPYVRIAEDKE